MTPTKVDLTIYQGATFRWPFYWYSDTEVVKPITAVQRTYPTQLTAVAHGLPTTSAVPVALLDVADWINTVGVAFAERLLPNEAVAYATFVDVDNFTVKLDSTGQSAYSGNAGRLVYNAPVDLSAWSARMQIREAQDSTTVLQAFTNADGSIVLAADGKAELDLSAVQTDLLTFATAVYDLELVDPNNGEVTRLAFGKVTLSPQVTR